MRSKALFAGLVAVSLSLAPAAWSDEHEHKDGKKPEGMMHEGMMKDGMMMDKAKDKGGKPMAKGKKMKKEKKMKKAKEHWVCPMKDGGESDRPGRCPKCGMNLVKEEAKAEPKPTAQPKADEDHSGHKH